MTRYSVYVVFVDDRDFQFETITNPLNVQAISTKGAELIMTEDEYGINILNVIKMEDVEIGKGQIGEYVLN